MKTSDLDRELREVGRERLPAVPEMIRRRQDEIYASLADLPLQTNTGPKIRLPKIRKAVGAVSAAAIIAVTGGLCSAAVSPAMAGSLKSLPLIGGIFRLADDLGLRTAEERGLAAELDASATHGGITLRVPQLVFDGMRLSVAIKREGEGFTGGIMDFMTANKGLSSYPRGAVNHFEMLIDGTPSYDYQDKMRVGLKGSPTSDPNAMLFELTTFSGLSGGSANVLPDRFVLTAKIWLEGVEEPFVFELPVRKNTERLVTPFKQSKEWNGVKLTLERIEFTPITTLVNVNLQSSDKTAKLLADNIHYELWDDSGRQLGLVSGIGVYSDNEQKEMISELLFDRFADAPKSVTLKAFLPEFADPSANAGSYKLDGEGEIVKTYLQDLEIIIPVDHSGLEKLYGRF
ncbi:DUF4179 domain-containing protein [Paenibacillus hamazuiensis]|uniref:DUF4179 domain-containing protein n=1 Tax=Paenibacillus hamazuiensis TaxID=2936508 RepID=UPI00200F83C0|nr:DUF4179 domain-containing protein [Paenibacillus hamazuiensis]